MKKTIQAVFYEITLGSSGKACRCYVAWMLLWLVEKMLLWRNTTWMRHIQHTFTYIHARTVLCSVTQSHLTLCNIMDCSSPGFSVHGIPQARILESAVISSFRGSSWPRDQTLIPCISYIGRWILYHWATWEARIHIQIPPKNKYFQ